MATGKIMRNRTELIALAGASAMLLAGCSSNTYGTGVSQNSQLISDITSIAKIGPKERKRINYAARPGLVKAPAETSLPTPAETVSSNSGYFPVDPEVRRQQLRRQASTADGTIAPTYEVSPELQALREESKQRAKANADPYRGKFIPHAEIVRRRKEYIAKNGNPNDTDNLKVRKYLTQPPVEYSVPAETAPIGQVGEKETDFRKPRKSKNLLSRIFGS